MKKRILISIGIVSGFVLLGIAAYAFINMQEDGPTVAQQSIDTQQVRQQITENPETVVRQGDFTDADLVHRGSGQAKVVTLGETAVLKFENFQTTPGPDLFVYLSPNAAGEGLGEYVSLGPLQSDSGDQVYTLPDDYEKYKTVVVWCRAFAVTFTTAELQ